MHYHITTDAYTGANPHKSTHRSDLNDAKDVARRWVRRLLHSGATVEVYAVDSRGVMADEPVAVFVAP